MKGQLFSYQGNLWFRLYLDEKGRMMLYDRSAEIGTPPT